jgi:hypothetical protein
VKPARELLRIAHRFATQSVADPVDLPYPPGPPHCWTHRSQGRRRPAPAAEGCPARYRTSCPGSSGWGRGWQQPRSAAAWRHCEGGGKERTAGPQARGGTHGKLGPVPYLMQSARRQRRGCDFLMGPRDRPPLQPATTDIGIRWLGVCASAEPTKQIGPAQEEAPEKAERGAGTLPSERGCVFRQAPTGFSRLIGDRAVRPAGGATTFPAGEVRPCTGVPPTLCPGGGVVRLRRRAQ